MRHDYQPWETIHFFLACTQLRSSPFNTTTSSLSFYVVSDTIMSIGKSLGSVNASPVYTYVLQWWWELCLSQTLLDNSPVQNTAHQLEKKQVRQELFQVVLFFFFPLFHRKVARISNDMAFSSAFKRKQKVNKQTSMLKKYITHFAP